MKLTLGTEKKIMLARANSLRHFTVFIFIFSELNPFVAHNTTPPYLKEVGISKGCTEGENIFPFGVFRNSLCYPPLDYWNRGRKTKLFNSVNLM